MNIQVFKKESFKTSQWEGGTTTELYTYPENGDYGKRDFEIRISSATVELEKSNFTKLQGIERWLMVLDGNLKIQHEDQHLIFMHPHDITRFMGDLNTVSFGQAKDFNLMLNKGIKGQMIYRCVDEDHGLVLKSHCPMKYIIYPIEGSSSIGNENLEEQGLAVIEVDPREVCMVKNSGEKPLKLGICEIEI